MSEFGTRRKILATAFLSLAAAAGIADRMGFFDTPVATRASCYLKRDENDEITGAIVINHMTDEGIIKIEGKPNADNIIKGTTTRLNGPTYTAEALLVDINEGSCYLANDNTGERIRYIIRDEPEQQSNANAALSRRAMFGLNRA